MSSIWLLPEHLIDQIKAGEVVERPASLIKELVENSIDAHAHKIKIHIVNNGLELIEVSDDGMGIGHDDLPLAFHRHATSKIKNLEDLYRLGTFGFRGEALASIAAVSKIKCQTSLGGGSLSLFHADGGKVTLHHLEKETAPSGTSLFIKDLFYNTPARLKFVQSETQEKNQIKKILNHFMVIHPDVAFEIKWDDKDPQIFHATTTEKRLADLIKLDVNRIKCLEKNYAGHKVVLWFSTDPTSSGRHQYLSANSRMINHKQIQAIVKNLLSAWSPNPDFYLQISTPASEIDVNVHPSKTQVKFLRPNEIIGLITTLTSEENQKSKAVTPAPVSPGMLQGFEWKDNFKNLDVSQYAQAGKSPLQEKEAWRMNEFLIMKEDHELLVYNLPVLIRVCLKQILKSTEPEVTPLLVSLPLKTIGLSEYDQMQMKRIGFEIDRLHNQTLVLRSYPSLLGELPIHELAENIIQKMAEVHSLEESIEKFILPVMAVHGMEEFIGTFSHSFLFENGVVKSITADALKKLFHEK